MKSTKTKALIAFCLLQFSISSVNAQLVGEFPDGGGAISITTTDGPIETAGLNFDAIEGTLTFGTDPKPFQICLSPNEASAGDNVRNVILGSIGTTAVLDGTIVLDVIA